MNRTIWKYTLPIQDSVALEMPSSSQCLCVAVQNGALCLWALVTPGTARVKRLIKIYGTGLPGPSFHESYVGTVQLGPFVWHVFDAGIIQ